jgi:hypothetical protein
LEEIGIIEKSAGGALVEIMLRKVLPNFFSRNGWTVMARFGYQSK